MLSILVCHSYFLRFDPKQAARGKPYPPLATLQLAALLRQAGHEVSLFDAMLASGLEEYYAKLRSTAPQVVVLYEDNFNYLSKMCLGKMREAACQMVGAARAAGARVIVAGPDVSDAPVPYLHAGADLALTGEGLVPLMGALPRLQGDLRIPPRELLDGLPGAAALLDGRVARNSERHGAGSAVQPAEIAAWDLVDMDHYRSVWTQKHGYFSLNMAASRGCSFRCAWCAKPIWGNQYLQRTARSVAAEMGYLKRTFAPDHIWLADDIFGFRVDWVQQFAEAVAAHDDGVPFTIQTRADLVSVPMAEALEAAGCREAWLGAESGSQRVLDAMHKGTTVAEIITARGRLQQAGIRVGFFIQLGYLDEQLTDIIATRTLLETARPDDVGVSVAYPLPGTRFYELVKSQLASKTHWQDSDDLAMMFEGTYTTEFYRAVRDLLHEEIRVQQAEQAESAAKHRRARRTLERRWQSLLAREQQFLSCKGADIVLGSAAAAAATG
jgi:anaerobic magnesium-protoporphyrin IX monomethyl ester cyclase